jgi:Tol biopolymer transport system component
MCDVIPGVTQEFRGALGSVNRPFAIPNDDGEEILIRLRPVCEPDSPGFADLPGGLAPEDDYFVTILFEPPGAGARNAVVLGTAANRDRCEALASAAALPNGGRATCAVRPFAGLCSGGSNDGGLCTGDAECPEGTCLAPPGSPDLAIRDECVGGPSAGQACTDAAQCGEGGACLPFRLRFRFPDTDGLVGTPDDDRTLTGPATIAVTAVSDPLPLGLATARCAGTSGLVACIDELYARDGTCETGSAHIDPTFGHFTALPPPNDYQALCTTATPGSPCTGLQTEARFTVDAAGNALVPMDYRGVLIQADRIPVPRLIQGNTKLPAFSGAADPVAIPSEAFLSSWAPGGQKLPPIFTPIADPTASNALSLFGSIDAPVGVIRVQRRGCAGGADEGRVCTEDAECGTGATCATLFEFADRLAGGVGPVLIARAGDELRLDAQSPVPLDGLIASESIFAFVANEAIGEPQDDCDGDSVLDCTRLNDDSDGTDPVLRLRDRATGQILPIGTNTVFPGGAEGRAVTRVKAGRFRFPAVAIDGDTVAFLELEPSEGHRDTNANGSVFDPILRVYRVLEDCGSRSPCAVEITASLPTPIAVDAAPLVDGRSLELSDGRLYFRIPEWRHASQVTERVSVASDGTEGNAWSGPASLSSDGRFVAFDSEASNLVRDDTNSSQDIFVHDRSTGVTERVSVATDGGEANSGALDPSVSSDGRFVAFHSSASNLVPSDRNGSVTDIFVHDRSTGVTELVSVASDGGEGNSTALNPSLSSDGGLVAFRSDASNLVPGDTNNWHDIFVHDRSTGVTERASVASDGGQANLESLLSPSLSSDGRVAAFDSRANTLVPGDTNFMFDIFAHDRVTGKTERLSLASDGTQTNGSSLLPSLSSHGQVVAFMSGATDLVPGDTNGFDDIFVRDRVAGETERVSVASDGLQANSASVTPSLSADGRVVAFWSVAGNLVPADTNGVEDTFIHDRTTGATERVSVASVVPSLSSDGRVVAFLSLESLVPGDANGMRDVFVRGPNEMDLDSDLSDDGDLGDTVLAVLDVATGVMTPLCPAGAVAVNGGSAAFLRPMAAGPCAADAGPGGSGGPNGVVVHLFVPGQGVTSLDRDAKAVALSTELVGALVSSISGTTDAQVYDRTAHSWLPTGEAADSVAVVGRTLAFTSSEADMGADRNGDHDLLDRVLRIFRVEGGALVDVSGFPAPGAEDFVLGERLVAFRASEVSQATDLNDDGDLDDDVMQVFDLASERLFSTEQAVTPCPLEACDPRFPYRVEGDTVVFITPESQQSGTVLGTGCHPARDGGCDLNGDGDSRDLVKQVFNVREAALRAGPSPAASLLVSAVTSEAIAAAGSVDAVASASAGICTTTGDACATGAECGAGTCYLPPGGCIVDLGTSCVCGQNGCHGCAEGQFCEPFPSGGGNGSCHQEQGPCTSQAECMDPRATCRDAAADVQRLLAPTDPGVVTSSGACVEPTGGPCEFDADCTGGDLCGASGTCERRHGSCLTDLNCAEGLRCAPNLVTVAAADSDGDALLDPLDNCPEVANADQADLDGDGVGDCCDLAGPDDDSDGVPNPLDNCRNHPNPNQRDSDSDGYGNACDLDYTNDGVVDGSDLARIIAAFASRSGSERYDERIDVNGDGVIGGLELAALGRSFGDAPGPTALAACGSRSLSP